MSIGDTARALMALTDSDLRKLVAAGDFGQFEGYELDDNELTLLRDAARGEADDDTEGFGSFAPPYVPVGPNVPLMKAMRYVEDGIAGSPVQPEFNSWTARVGAQGTW